MESVTELFPGEGHTSRVWVTPRARKDWEKRVSPDLQKVMRTRAAKGFFGIGYHDEGRGIRAYSKGNGTERIAGYFHHPLSYEDFIMGGSWKGKPGAKKRPSEAEGIVDDLVEMKRQGVLFPNGQTTPPPKA